MDREILPNTLQFDAYIILKKGIIIYASSAFFRMTNYEAEDINGIRIEDMWSVMRIHPALDYEALREEREYYLFDKNYMLKVVNITIRESEPQNEIILVFTQKHNTQIDDKFPFFEELYSDNNIGIALYSFPGKILLKANDMYLSFLDGSHNRKENVIGKSIEEFIVEWKGSELEKAWNNIISTGKPWHADEYMYKGPAGGVSYWAATLTPIRENNIIKYCIQTVNNITERVVARKRFEEQAGIIAQQKEQLEAIIRNMSDGLMIIDGNYEYKFLNEAARDFFYKPDEMKKHGDSFVHTKYYDDMGNMISKDMMPVIRVLKGQRIKQFRLTGERPDKTVHLSISGSPIFDKDGNVAMAIMCSRDITDQINYEEILKSQRDYFYKIIDTLDLPIIRLSYPDYIVIELNKKAKQLLNEIHPHIHFDVNAISKGDSVKGIPAIFLGKMNYNHIVEMERTKNITRIEKHEIIRNGKKSYVNIVLQPILNTKKEIAEVLIIIIDITPEVEQRQALERILKIQEEFFSFIAHEFKTPIAITNAAVQAMEFLCRDELSQRAKGYLRKIRQSSLQQLRLVNNLLDIIRADAGYLKIHRKNADIVGMTRAIIESVLVYAKGKGVEIKFIPCVDYKVIAVDDEKYERILLNLLSNAIKFTPSGKSIYVSASQSKNKICIEVKDEGVGIPKDKQAVIFERFGQVDSSLTRKSEGTGIGLCLVKFLVNAMNGEIKLSSKLGKGSNFKIFLPDETVENDINESYRPEGEENRLMQIVNVEFSNIYTE